MYSAMTRSINILVEPTYLDDQSEPEQDYYVWAYHVTIKNQGPETVRLRARYWKITDAAGHVHEVRGPGVVGEQPLLRPGETFEYTSGTPLGAPSGIMFGNYQMETDSGETFEVDIPAFSLDSPHASRMLH
ncbi:MAG: Co2+/Mg2+ efflux protein ApaG [Parvibaculum sp.]|nr:Co2+/Mg2+ efflux protein ApaG [Parvibaculum sp.]